MNNAQHIYIAAIANGEERPFIEMQRPELQGLATENWDVPGLLYEIGSELRIRISNRLARGESPRRKVIDLFEEIRDRVNELADISFPEPPNAKPGRNALPEADWPSVGLLKHMGYTVSQSENPGERARRIILNEVFTGPVPNVCNPGYMNEWATDGSPHRLQKMAWSIASFANNRLRSNDGKADDAIAAWTSDLVWLREAIYKGHFGFPWPQIGIEK